MKETLEYLFAGNKLTREQAKSILVEVASDKFPHAQVAAFTSVYRMRQISIAELQGFRDALLSLRVPINLEGRETVDIVGTGGDGKNTFNISTTSAFVIAGAGYPVSKHGSYGVSSNCGSSNVLMDIGVEFSSAENTILRQLDKAGICFFHAPLFHPAMKAVVPIRKDLKVKTFFNMLGPLTNPAQPKFQLFGTYSEEVAELYNELLYGEGKQYAVVYALDGYDEVSLTEDVLLFSKGEKNKLSPSHFGLPSCAQSALHGGETIADSKKILLNVLKGEGSAAQQNAVLANSALAIHVCKKGADIESCVAEARESIESGKAFEVLKKLIG